MSKIIIRLKGGLGNQLFQMNVAWFLNKKFGCEIEYDTKTGYLTDKFNRTSSADIIFGKETYAISKTILNNIYILRLFKLISTRLNMKLFGWKYLEEDFNITTRQLMMPDLYHKYKKIYLEGYWQSPKLITESPFLELLKSICTSNTRHLLSENQLIIHYRALQVDNVLSHEYYLNALKRLIENDTKSEIDEIIIYSDSKKAEELYDYLKQAIILSQRVTMKVDITEYEPFELMVLFLQSKYFIPSKSTFSYWVSCIDSGRHIFLPNEFAHITFNKIANSNKYYLTDSLFCADNK